MTPEQIEVARNVVMALLGALGTCIAAWFNRDKLAASVQKDKADAGKTAAEMVQTYQKTVSDLLDEVNGLRLQVAEQATELAAQRGKVVRLEQELERGREEIMQIRERLRLCEEARGVRGAV